MKAEICIGVSASGKTTHGMKRAKQGWICLDRDDMRFSLRKVRDWRDYGFDRKIEKIISDMHCTAISSAARLGLNVCIAETNLGKRTRSKWEHICKEAGYEVEFVPMHIELDEAIRRNEQRDNGLRENVIRNQWKLWTKYLEEEKQ